MPAPEPKPKPAELKPTRDQQRAQAAFLAVSEVVGGPLAKDYGRQCLRLPFLIQQDGLCLTVAFLKAKAKGGKKPYFDRLVKDFLVILGSDDDKIRTADSVTYQRLSREGIRVALWFKRYAEAVLGATHDDPKGDAEPGAPD